MTHTPSVILEVVFINVILSGDNAVIIAMASRGLSDRKSRRLAIFVGVFVAVLFRLLALFFAHRFLEWPGAGLISAFILGWTAFSLVKDYRIEVRDSADRPPPQTFSRAVYLIVINDLLISIDNVLAIASIARGNYLLLVLGVLISIPMVIFLSHFFARLLEKYPLIFWVGIVFIGFIAGKLFANDVLFAWSDRAKFVSTLFFSVLLPVACYLLARRRGVRKK